MRTILLAMTILFSIVALAADDKKEEAAVNDKAFHEALLKVAKEYASYGRVDDWMRWAPYLCGDPGPSTARLSASKDSATHGSKLYFLFAKNRELYMKAGERSDPAIVKLNLKPVDQTGQVIVKEGWVAKEEPADTVLVTVGQRGQDRYLPYAKKDGKLFHADTKAALFIMLKLDPKTPGTDEGWVYGTVSADGRNVTSAGRVASCMGCHQDAKVDRLFGLSPAK